MTRRIRLVGPALGSLVALAAGQAPAGAIPATTATYRMYVTLYGARDNDPPGTARIAYPVLHSRAGGTGTWDDPVTFATDKAELPPGTRIYYPRLRKYFVMEDDCAACRRDWAGQGARGPGYRHIDLWAGDSTDAALSSCERSLTSAGRVPVVVDPLPDEPVDPTPIFDPATLTCYTP